MSFLDILQAAQALALADRLKPTELSAWERLCREYSKTFSTPLTQVMEFDPEFVMRQVYSDNFSNWNLEERLEDIRDTIGFLSDPDYDAKRERALREETEKILAEERDRIKEGRAVHESLETKKNTSEKEVASKALPKSGGINMNLLQRLQNDGET